MSVDPSNKHVTTLVENVEESRRLRQFKFKSSAKGDKAEAAHDKEVLYKSSIVLLVACWESFLVHLVSGSSDHKKIPFSVLERISSSQTGMKIWDLAGDGWKTVIRDNLKSVLAKTVGTFNTPRATQVNELFKKSIGLENISSFWQWAGTDSAEAEKELDDLITLRGSIAHRVKTSEQVQLQDVKDAEKLILCLSTRTHNTIVDFLETQIGKSPWKRIIYDKNIK